MGLTGGVYTSESLCRARVDMEKEGQLTLTLRLWPGARISARFCERLLVWRELRRRAWQAVGEATDRRQTLGLLGAVGSGDWPCHRVTGGFLRRQRERCEADVSVGEQT